MGILGTLVPYLAGAATALAVQAAIQLYVVPRVETRKRREDRFERNVLELGELLTSEVSRQATDAHIQQVFFLQVKLTDYGPEWDRESGAGDRKTRCGSP